MSGHELPAKNETLHHEYNEMGYPLFDTSYGFTGLHPRLFSIRGESGP